MASDQRGDKPASAEETLDAVFARERARLVGLAYRITGSRLDAEDIVQEAWLRAEPVDWSTIDNADAWLTTVVSRLALDHLKSARRRRESYVGPWLPEPVRTNAADGVSPPPAADPAHEVEVAESLTFGFLRLLEALAPVERVVFLLADVFEVPYREIAVVVDRSPDACRQIAVRARRRVRAGRVRRDSSEASAAVVSELLWAVVAGDVERVVALLADDVVLVSDGGEFARAARRPVRGSQRVARMMVNLARRLDLDQVELAVINGDPGMVASVDGQLFVALSAEVVEGRVHALHFVRNPDKLAALAVSTAIT